MSVTATISDGVARIEIDDGKANALSAARLTAISAALDEARKADAIAVIAGRPGIFSAGFDMKTFARGPAAAREMVAAGVKAIADILGHPRPVATFCTGHAYPMGAFLMLAADLRLGVDGDFRIGMNETAIGIAVPDFALALAKARLSQPASAAIPIARMFSPREAVGAGYLDHVGDEAQMRALLETEIARLKQLSPAAFASTKARNNRSLIADLLGAGLPAELAA